MIKRFTQMTRILTALVLTTCVFAVPFSADASSSKKFPSERHLSLIVPYPAGGPSDLAARVIAESMDSFLEHSVIVDNIGGATGTIAARRMLSGPADGYTFFHGSPNELIIPTVVNKSVTFKPEEFELVQTISTSTIVVLTRGDLGVDTLDDLIRLAQNKDGAPLTYASVGTGSMYHLITEHMAKEVDLHVQHIPYRGSAPALTDLAGGQIDFAVLVFQTSMIGLQNEQRLKILSALGNEVPAPLKDIPKAKDSKLLKDFDYSIMGGYFVKKGTPEDTKNVLRQAISNALEQPSVRDKFEMEGRIIATPMTAEENNAVWKAQIESIRNLIDSVGFEPV